jgi:hypothetical protein
LFNLYRVFRSETIATERKRKRQSYEDETIEKKSSGRQKRLECVGAEVIANLFLGTEKTALNLPWLKETKITHILNCAKEAADLFKTGRCFSFFFLPFLSLVN